MPEWGIDSRELWAAEQLAKARLPEPTMQGVLRLLTVWWKLPKHAPEFDAQILHVFSELVQDHALEAPAAGFDWVPVRPGQIKVADIVRIKLNAYQGEIGKLHNGRVARVVAIRSGDIIVNSVDDGPKFEGVHHSPYSLDKRISRDVTV